MAHDDYMLWSGYILWSGPHVKILLREVALRAVAHHRRTRVKAWCAKIDIPPLWFINSPIVIRYNIGPSGPRLHKAKDDQGYRGRSTSAEA